MKIKIVTLIIIISSIICGVFTQDYFFGTLILISGLLNAYYASLGKIYNYFWGAIFCLLNSYVSYINGLNGIAILSLVIYFPSQIQGYLSWSKKKDVNNEVKVREFTVKNSIIITVACIVGSFGLGVLLSKIPGQKLAFLDSSSNIINMCGIILMNLRFKECWIIWLFNNVVDLSIWITNTINNSPNSKMMLLVSIGYLCINIYGLIKWSKNAKVEQNC